MLFDSKKDLDITKYVVKLNVYKISNVGLKYYTLHCTGRKTWIILAI
jgi:hypothetical protein